MTSLFQKLNHEGYKILQPKQLKTILGGYVDESAYQGNYVCKDSGNSGSGGIDSWDELYEYATSMCANHGGVKSVLCAGCP